MYLFMYVRNSETLLVLHFRMWFTGFPGDTWESVLPQDTLPPTHPICHSVCPCMDFTTAASSSWHTYCREEGGRLTTCSVSYFHRFIWTLQKLYLNTCRTHSRDSELEVQILKYLEMEADFKALLIIEHSCSHLLTLRFAASLYGRTWQQSSPTLLSGTSLCSNTGQSLSFTEKINVKQTACEAERSSVVKIRNTCFCCFTHKLPINVHTHHSDCS